MTEKKDIKQAFAQSEKIGVIGSPSSTGGLTIDVLGTAIEKSLVGHMSVFQFKQDQLDHYALGQITEITMQNPWTQDPTMRGIIRRRERVDPVTEKQDIHTANMIVSSVFSHNENIEASILGNVPPTGTSIRLLNEEMMSSLLVGYQNELFYLGNTYGTQIKMPMWLKHFGKDSEGIGEAYHIGVFGKTGSGKSILATMMTMGYARHKKMSIFILDPQGQFSKEFKNPKIKENIEKNCGKKTEIISLFNLVLTGNETIRNVLIYSGFLKKFCNIKFPQNQEQAAMQIENILRGRQVRGQQSFAITTENFKPWHYYKREAFNQVWNTLLNSENVQRAIYTSQDVRQGMINAIQSADINEAYNEWQKIMNLFSYENKTHGEKIKDIIKKIIKTPEDKGNILIIDLSETNVPDNLFWTDEIKNIVIEVFLAELIEQAEEVYKNGNLLNTLVILDEAHRLAPKEKSEDESLEKIKTTLIDAIRTTRKYGLGWMFISQTLSSLDKEIINQIRIFIFGFGLAWGIEQQSLREIIGGNKEAIKLYQMFKDPQSSLGEREYSFMTVGPISPLSFSGTPLFFTSIKYPADFLKINFEGTAKNEGS
jgi:hypothetical protein